MARKFPWLILLLFRLRFLRPAPFELGDIMEEYSTGTRSRAWLWRQALSLLWPGTYKSDNTYNHQQRKDGMTFISSFLSDVRYTARTLLNNPGFTTVAVLAIALGIGVNTGIFTVLNGVALRPLPVLGASQVVSMYQSSRGMGPRNVRESASLFSWPEYQTYRDSNQVLTGLLAYEPFLSVTLGGDRPRQLYGQFASCNYFDVLNELPPRDAHSRPPIARQWALEQWWF